MTAKQMYEKYVSLKRSDTREAYKWLEKAADAGYAQAYEPLGEYYMHVGPLSIKENVARAEKYFLKAKNAGIQDDYGYNTAHLYARAMGGESLNSRECYQIAQMMQAGLFGAVKSDERALIWFQEASRKGDESADFRISQIYKKFAEEALRRKNYDEVMRFADKFNQVYESYGPLEEIAEQMRKDAAAIYPNDKKAFRKPLEYAARMGNAHAMYTLGIQYCAGTYIPKDEVKGLALIQASDRLGYPDAARTYRELKTTFDNVSAYNNRVLQEQQKRANAEIMAAVTAGALLVATVAIIGKGIKSMASYSGGGYSYSYCGSASVTTPEADARAEDKAKAREMLAKCRPELTHCVQKDTDYWVIELGTGKEYSVERNSNGRYKCNAIHHGLLAMGAYGLMDAFISDYSYDSLEEAKQGLLKEEIAYYNKALK
jgi:TPR repeat protein